MARGDSGQRTHAEASAARERGIMAAPVERCRLAIIPVTAASADGPAMNLIRPALWVLALCSAFPAIAMTDGRTSQDRPFMSGGVSQDELADLRTQQPFFSVSVLTAAKGSGAHLAGVKVKITDATGKAVLETEMDGPYLLVDLLPGKYELEAVNEGETQKRVLNVRQGAAQRVVLYFKSDAEVSPDLKN
jgi:hypothetical protein